MCCSWEAPKISTIIITTKCAPQREGCTRRCGEHASYTMATCGHRGAIMHERTCGWCADDCAWCAALPGRLKHMHSHWLSRALGAVVLRGVRYSDRSVHFVLAAAAPTAGAGVASGPMLCHCVPSSMRVRHPGSARCVIVTWPCTALPMSDHGGAAGVCGASLGCQLRVAQPASLRSSLLDRCYA